MVIHSVYDKAFAPYGKVLEGYDTAPLVQVLNELTPLPEGTVYEPSMAALEALSIAKQLQDNAYGGMPVQLGYCNGHNTKLNCLEYHRDSELNCGTEDFILLLAKQENIIDGKLDTACVEAFRVPAGVLVEVYATSLHYAPCSHEPGAGFRVLVVLPRGTNTDAPALTALNLEDQMLRARNKWLLAHPESDEAADKAYVGLTGKNIDLAVD